MEVDKTAVATFVVVPFLVSAAWNFLPMWVAAPTAVILGMVWVGSLMR